MIRETSGKLGVFFLALRYKTAFFLIPSHEKNLKKRMGGVKNFCNFVAEYVKPILVLRFRRYKTRYKKIILSRIVYE